MTKLLSLALLALVSAPLSAQTVSKPATTISDFGDTAVLISNVDSVTSVVSFRGYLLNEYDMDAAPRVQHAM